MNKRKIAALILAMTITNLSSTSLQVWANEVPKSTESITENKGEDYTKAKVSKFIDMNSEFISSYDKEYKIGSDKIESITTNGGQHADNSIKKAMDGDINTNWHSGKRNSDNFKNEVVIELKEPTTLNRIVYTAPRGTNRGFAQEFDIYASTTTDNNDFKLISSGSAEPTQDSIEIKFKPTEFKKIKFVFKKSYENWACASEFGLYTQDEISEKVEKLFTNGLMTEVSEEFKKPENLTNLESEIKSHPLEKLLMEDIQLAKDIINNVANISNPTEVERRGNSIQEANKRKLWSFQDWQVTGLTARPGDVLNVYVDVKDDEPTPKLIYKQSINRHGSSTTFNLSKGRNRIVIPEYDNKKDDVAPGTIFGGALYLTNYESNNQTVAPMVRIEGGKKYPMFVEGKSNDKDVMNELEEYVKKINDDPKNVVDVFDVSTDKVLVTVKATYALEWYKENNKVPSYTVNKWNKTMDEIYSFWGFDGSSELNSRFNSRMIFMTKNLTGGTFMNASNGIVGVRPSSQADLLNVTRGWGLMHEIGHNMDTAGRTMVELTNNIVPIYIGALDNGVSRITTDNVWERKIYPKVSMANYSDNPWQGPDGEDSLAQLSPLWQLNLYNKTFYSDFEKVYRANNFNLQNRQQIIESWVKVSSDILKLNLYEFFERHGIHASEDIKKEVSKYPKPSGKLWYLNDKKFNYNGNGFKEATNLNLSLSDVSNGIKLKFDVADNVKSDLLGYEIVKDGEIIGFTANNEFIDTKADKSKNSKYEVIPYDLNLGTGGSVVVNSRNDLATNFYISVGGVNYKGDQALEGLRVNFDLKDKKMYLTNRVNGEIHSGFRNNEYFTLKLLDKDKNVKTSITLNGNERPDSSKLNDLNFVNFQIGDYVEVYHKEPFRLNIHGQKQKESKEVYIITEKGLVKKEKIDGSTISIKGSGKGAFELLFRNNVIMLQNRVSGVFANENTGFNNYYIEVILKSNDGRTKVQSSLYGSMFSENIELDKLDGVNYEYGDTLTINHMSPQHISLNAPIIGNKSTGSTQVYELTKEGFKMIK